MKLTNDTIIKFANSPFGGKHLPVKLAYAIAANAEAVAGALKAYNEARQKLVEQFAKKDEEGNLLVEDEQYVIDDNDGWNEAVRELFEAEAEVNVTTVSLKELAKCDESEFDSLTVAEMAVLNFMIK